MPEIEKAVSEYALDSYYEKALDLVISGRARKAFDLDAGEARDCATSTAGTRSASRCCSPAG